MIIYVEEGHAHGAIPSEIDGVKTVVAITDRFRATGWNQSTERRGVSRLLCKRRV